MGPVDPETGLTALQQSFAVNLAQTGNVTRAYKDASPRRIKDTTAAVEGYKALRIPKVARYWRQLCQQARTTPDEALAAVGRSLRKEKVIRDEAGQEIEREIDAQAQLKAADMILRIHGAYAADKPQPQSSKSSVSKHLHLHGSEAVRAFVLATGRLPSAQEMSKLESKDAK